MRTIITSILLLSILTSVAQKKQIAETSIQNVTVFSSGARIQRIATVVLQTGRSEIRFEGLSNQLDQQTVQLKADANITLLSVQTEKDYLTERKLDQDEKSYVEKIATLTDKIEQDTKQLEVFKNEEAMLIKNQAIGGNTGVKAVDLKEALDLQRQRLTEIYARELEIQKRMDNEQKDLEKYAAQLKEFSKKKDSVSYVVTCLLDSKEARTVHFQLLYNVKDAGWYPTYDLRLDDVSKPLNILMNANVFQRSGETWKNVALFLSTGNPNDNATPSLLQPWMLGFYDPTFKLRGKSPVGTVTGRVTDESGQPIPFASIQIKSEGKSVSTDENGFFRFTQISGGGTATISAVGYNYKEIAFRPGYFTVQLQRSSMALNEVVVVGYSTSSIQGSVAGLQIQQQKKESIQTVQVVTQFQPTTTVYSIEDRYTLETNGKTTSIGIREFEVPAIYDYYSSPKTDPSVFLTACVVNWQDYQLVSGEVSLYFEGTYLGKTYLDLSSVADTLSLSLGKDNGIKISRKLVKEFSGKKFIGGNRTDTKDYEISIRNTKQVPVTVLVQDQFPVSTSKEIDVDDMKAPDAQVDKEDGMASWKIVLAPGAEKKLSIGYRVKYPKDRIVVLD